MLTVMCSRNGNSSGSRRRSGYTTESETHHLADSDTKRTLCGRDASDWIKVAVEPQEAAASSYCCRRCLGQLPDAGRIGF